MEHVSQVLAIESLLPTSGATTNESHKQSESTRRENRAHWFRQMLNRLHVQRKIELEPERIAAMLEMLHQENYTAEQAARADLWLSYGNWTFKGTNPTLEYADLFPDEEQVEGAKSRKVDAGFVVMTQDQYRQAMRKAFYEGQRSGQAEAWQEEQKRNTSEGKG